MMNELVKDQTTKKSTKIELTKKIVIYTIIYIFLIIGALSMLFPYFWMVMTSFKDNLEAISLSLVIFPKIFMFDTYREIWEMIPLVRGIFNTLVVEIAVIGVGTFVTALAAFSFSKMKLKFKTGLLLMLMSGMMIPYAVLLLPQYRAFLAVGLTNTLWPLILPGFFGNITMMFFFIQYMKGVPNSFFEAAKIDGASYLTMFVRIMIPLIKPAIAAQMMFWFIGIWNDFFAPSIYLKDYDVMTLQPMLSRLNSSSSGGTNLPLIMTGAVLTSLPLLFIYIGFQKFFIESLAISGVKG